MAKSETYEKFVEKFKPKKTTDDCYTPPIVYNAVTDFVAGLFVGARKFSKYTLPCKWVMLPVSESAEIQSLIEDGPDFPEIEFWHNGTYYSFAMNASDYVPQGLVRVDGGEYYKSCTVTFAQR